MKDSTVLCVLIFLVLTIFLGIMDKTFWSLVTCSLFWWFLEKGSNENDKGKLKNESENK